MVAIFKFTECSFLFYFLIFRSLDAKIWPKINNSDVPLWNYCVLRTQV